MGCLVAKSTIRNYEAQIQQTEDQIVSLNSKVAMLENERNVSSLDCTDTLGTLAYQEQLRENYILSLLGHLFLIESEVIPNNENAHTEFETYVNIRISQTELEKKLMQKFHDVFDKVKELNDKKITQLREKVEELGENNKISAKARDNILKKLEEDVFEAARINSIETAIDSFLQKCQFDLELEMIQRKYDFKCFSTKEKNKISKQDGNQLKLVEMQNDIRTMQKQWNDLRNFEIENEKEKILDEQEIKENEKIINNLIEAKAELKQEIEITHKSVETLLKLEEEYNSKLKDAAEHRKILENLNEEIATLKSFPSSSELKKQNRELKNKIAFLQQKIIEFEDIRLNIINEREQKKQEELKKKLSRVSSLELKIKVNKEQIVKVEKSSSARMKKHIVIRLVNSLKNLMEFAFRVWRFQFSQYRITFSNTDEDDISIGNSFLVANSHYKNAVPWEPEKLYDFIDEFMKEKIRHDNARLKTKRIPKPVDKNLKVYMKSIYKSTNETEKSINMMIKALLMEEKKSGIALVLKKMLQISSDGIPYHISYLISRLWFEFDQIKCVSPNENEALLVDIFSLIDDIIEDNSLDAGPKLAQLIRPENMSKKQYFLLAMKLKFENFECEFPENCSLFENFSNLIKDYLTIFIDQTEIDQYLHEYYDESPENFFKNISNDVQFLDKEDYRVTKAIFLNSVIQVFNECTIAQIKALDDLTKNTPMINKELFCMLLYRLDDSLKENLLDRLFEETATQQGSFLSINPNFFKKIIIKYGIGGYGVGPFKCKQLSLILLQYLTKEKKRIERRPSDIIPYKISVSNSENSINQSLETRGYKGMLEILPTRAIRSQIKKPSRSPSPTPGFKTVVASKFFKAGASRSSSSKALKNPGS